MLFTPVWMVSRREIRHLQPQQMLARVAEGNYARQLRLS
jgi:hypothetical protein